MNLGGQAKARAAVNAEDQQAAPAQVDVRAQRRPIVAQETGDLMAASSALGDEKLYPILALMPNQ